MAERTSVLLLGGPSTDAVSVVGVVAGSPADEARLIVADLVGLAFKAGLVDAVLADGTVLDSNIPAPEGDCIPLLDLYAAINLH